MQTSRTIIAILWTSLTIWLAGCSANRPTEVNDDNPLPFILARDSDKFSTVLAGRDTHRLQIIYTQVDRDSENHPHLRTYRYRVNPEEYYYPASIVKLPAAALALEKLNQLAIAGLDRDTWLLIDSTWSGQTSAYNDDTSPTSLPSIGHYAHKALIVSDNDAFNRLYDFLGQETLNQSLWDKSYSSTRFVHRLSIALSPQENRHTGRSIFYDENGVIHVDDEKYNPVDYDLPAVDYILGKGELRGETVVMEPKNFRHKNFISLDDYHRLLIALMMPEAVPDRQRFDLNDDDYLHLYRSMSMLPRESSYPAYDADHYWDSYVKFLMFGNSKEPMPDNIRIFNKVGLAYGFLIDNAYIVDFEHGVEFFLSAVIYVNANQILNDGIYEYDQVGLPFLHHLGQAVYEYDRARPRQNQPDLTRYKFDYGSK